ncbi:MAG TPA: hypothetical protein VHW74_15645 [Mycobacteriales bacterium]|jgi:hypothetical protein|nr:hypothetical protein [Mycobacteriales bacterium]
MVRLRGALCVTLGLAIFGLSGCATSLAGLDFRTDKRLSFIEPHSREQVKLPVHLAWTMKDFTPAAPGSQPPTKTAGYFAIFVDHTAIKPGQSMRAVAHGDSFCESNPKCPDRGYLAERQIYTTTATSYVLHNVLPITNNDEHVQLHAAVIVLMDTAGNRIGESSWEIDFRTVNESDT